MQTEMSFRNFLNSREFFEGLMRLKDFHYSKIMNECAKIKDNQAYEQCVRTNEQKLMDHRQFVIKIRKEVTNELRLLIQKNCDQFLAKDPLEYLECAFEMQKKFEPELAKYQRVILEAMKQSLEKDKNN